MNSVGLWGLIFVSFLALSGVAAQSGVITWADLRLNDDQHSASLENGGADRSRLIVVSNDGRGDSLTVQGAIDLVPENNIQRVKIHIRPGVYREKVVIPANKPYITLIGDEDRANETVIVWQDKASDKTGGGDFLGTWNSASVTVQSDYFCASWITFENTVVEEADMGVNGYQAVALRVGGEHAMFYKARFLGSQDTLLDETGSHYFLQCFIQGTTDFIFGRARSLYMECDISVVGEGFAIAAHHRDSSSEDTGFSFVNCTVTGTGDVFLGRAWGDYSRIVYVYTQFDLQVRPEGWQDWGIPSRRNTAVFGLYGCGGRGAERNTSLDWSKTLNYIEAMPFLHTTFIGGDHWLRLYETNTTTTTPRTTTPVSGKSGNSPVVTGRPSTTTTTPRTTTPVSGTIGNSPVVTGHPNTTTTTPRTTPVSGTAGKSPVVTGRPNTTTPRTTTPVSGTAGKFPVVTGRPNTTTQGTTTPVRGTTGDSPAVTGRPNTTTTTQGTTTPVRGTTGDSPVVTDSHNTTNTTLGTTTPVSGTTGNSSVVTGNPNTTTTTTPVRGRSGTAPVVSGGANKAGIPVSNTILLALLLSFSALVFWV